jgi:hypothetical protein
VIKNSIDSNLQILLDLDAEDRRLPRVLTKKQYSFVIEYSIDSTLQILPNLDAVDRRLPVHPTETTHLRDKILN